VRMFSPQACEMYTLGLSCRKGKSVLQSPAWQMTYSDL
jgi:hypothetical protein